MNTFIERPKMDKFHKCLIAALILCSLLLSGFAINHPLLIIPASITILGTISIYILDDRRLREKYLKDYEKKVLDNTMVAQMVSEDCKALKKKLDDLEFKILRYGK